MHKNNDCSTNWIRRSNKTRASHAEAEPGAPRQLEEERRRVLLEQPQTGEVEGLQVVQLEQRIHKAVLHRVARALERTVRKLEPPLMEQLAPVRVIRKPGLLLMEQQLEPAILNLLAVLPEQARQHKIPVFRD